MSWGAPISAPMVIPPEPVGTAYSLPTPELEKIVATSTAAMRLADNIKKRTKALPRIYSKASMDSGRAELAAQESAAMGLAYGITRGQNKVNKMRAKAKGKAVQRQIDRGGRQYKRTGSKLATRNVRSDDQTANYFARNYLGMGTDLFKNVRL